MWETVSARFGYFGRKKPEIFKEGRQNFINIWTLKSLSWNAGKHYMCVTLLCIHSLWSWMLASMIHHCTKISIQFHTLYSVFHVHVTESLRERLILKSYRLILGQLQSSNPRGSDHISTYKEKRDYGCILGSTMLFLSLSLYLYIWVCRPPLCDWHISGVIVALWQVSCRFWAFWS